MRLTPALVSAATTLAVDQTTAEVVGAFTARGVSSLLLKGPSLGWLYPQQTRRYNDVDLLVAPSSYATAELVLGRLGFDERPATASALDPCAAQVLYIKAREGGRHAPVDLHRTIAFTTAAPETVWTVLGADSRQQLVAGERTAVLGARASALLLSLHAAQHPDEQLGKLEDLRRGIDRLSVDCWRGALAQADELGCREAFVLGLWTVDEGRALTRQLGLSRARVALGQTPPALLPRLIRVYTDTVSCESPGERVRQLSRRMFPSHAFMRQTVSIARRGWAGLAASYLMRLAGVPRAALEALGYLLDRRCG